MDDAPLQYTKPSSSISDRTQLWLCPALSQVNGAPTGAPREPAQLPQQPGFLSWLVPPSLIYACVILLPFPFNTTLFLAAGNPSWADNTPLESDLKSFLSFFLMLEVRKSSTFSFSPGEGEIAARPVGVLGAPLAACTDPLPRQSILGDGAGTRGPGWSQGSAGNVSQAPWGDTWLHNAKPSH